MVAMVKCNYGDETYYDLSKKNYDIKTSRNI